jgi:NADH-quinone oxidoreductase subunit N
MELPLIILELVVAILGLALLVLDLWTPPAQKRELGWVAVTVLVLVLLGSCLFDGSTAQLAFGGMYVLDGMALFFKRFFLVAAILVLIMAMEYADRLPHGITEYYSLILFALTGMMFAASANDFSLLFVALELITITFYVLAGFQRRQWLSLEAGVKYLIMGALASAFLVYGIALVYGTSTTLGFTALAGKEAALRDNPVFLAGVLLVVVGLGFKVAAFPFQLWVPDVYQGAPLPTMAFLAVGSKAAGFVLLLRVLGSAVPNLANEWRSLWMFLAAATILYGNLCAIPQRNLKRLLAYSGIANAGYLLLGVAALSDEGHAALLFYLAGYLFAVLGALFVLCQILGADQTDDLGLLAGLHRRSPLLAATLTLSLVSLAGIPPLAGFFGKFLLLKAVLARGAEDPRYYGLTAVALVGVVISLYYYLSVVRAIYWSRPATESIEPLAVSRLTRGVLYACLASTLVLGIFPGFFLNWASQVLAAVP